MSTTHSILIVMNPTSGGGRGSRVARTLAEALSPGGAAVRVVPTTGPGDAERITADALRAGGERPDVIVACGGDGTIHQVANALAAARAADTGVTTALGLAPSGRCNDFARALGIPLDAAGMARVLTIGESRPIDLGRVNGRYFCTVATVGIDAEVTQYVDSARLPINGTPAYLFGAVRVLMRYRAPAVRLEGDFGRFEGRVFLASTANTSSYGGSIPIVPQADPTDGVLHLCIIRAVSRWRALFLVPTVLRGRHERSPEVRIVATRRFRIDAEDADAPLVLWADGERLGATPATVEVVPGAIAVMLNAAP